MDEEKFVDIYDGEAFIMRVGIEEWQTFIELTSLLRPGINMFFHWGYVSVHPDGEIKTWYAGRVGGKINE